MRNNYALYCGGVRLSALKTVVMKNIQSHVNTILEFPEVGIIRLHGDNSNGKSVMVKGIWDVVNNDITKPKYRASLIRRGAPFGELTYTRYDGIELFVHIHREAAQTYAELRKPNEPPVRRYLADKTIPLLVQDFGMHYNAAHSISVNVHKDDDPFLFASTRHTVNFALMDSSMSDKYAEHSLGELQRLESDAKKTIKVFEQQKQVDEATLRAVVLYDVDKERDRREKLAYYAFNLSKCETRPLPDIRPVPSVVAITPIGKMPSVKYPKIYPKIEVPMPDISTIAKELEALQSNVCPTCGRDFHKGKEYLE